MNRAVNTWDCVARLYVPRSEGGQGLISVEDCVGQAKISLQSYVLGSNEKLLQAARKGDAVLQDLESAEGFKDRRRAEHKAGWQGKVLYGQLLR